MGRSLGLRVGMRYGHPALALAGPPALALAGPPALALAGPPARQADLRAIPSAAVARVEVLRDGAAAQYGSAAIAGVVNLVLREETDGGELTLHGGLGGGNG